jgi:hypothetical protein
VEKTKTIYELSQQSGQYLVFEFELTLLRQNTTEASEKKIEMLLTSEDVSCLIKAF